MNILSVRDADPVVVGVGLAMCGRKNNEYIKSRKFEMSVFMSYFSRFALQSSSKSSALFSNESFLIHLLGSHY